MSFERFHSTRNRHSSLIPTLKVNEYIRFAPLTINDSVCKFQYSLLWRSDGEGLFPLMRTTSA